MITLTVIASLVVLVTPMLRSDQRLRVMAAATILTSDIELAQTMTISEPEKPVSVVFNKMNNSYWLAYSETIGTPISREPSGTPYIVVIGAGRAVAAAGVGISTRYLQADILTFNAQGGLTELGWDPEIELKMGQLTFRLTVSATTGIILESELITAH